MAQGPRLTQDIKAFVARIHIEHPDYGPTSLREELLRRMKETGLDRNFGSNWPGVSAVGKLLQEIRDRETKIGPDSLDVPWSIDTMVKYPIPPEALPWVLRVWIDTRERLNNKEFTIRQALWVARLYAISKDVKTLEGMSRFYTLVERINEVFGVTISGRASAVDLDLFARMTGQEITPDREKKILGLTEEQWLLYQIPLPTKEEEDTAKRSETHSDDYVWLSKYMGDLRIWRLKRNERSHKKEE